MNRGLFFVPLLPAAARCITTPPLPANRWEVHNKTDVLLFVALRAHVFLHPALGILSRIGLARRDRGRMTCGIELHRRLVGPRLCVYKMHITVFNYTYAVKGGSHFYEHLWLVLVLARWVWDGMALAIALTIWYYTSALGPLDWRNGFWPAQVLFLDAPCNKWWPIEAGHSRGTVRATNNAHLDVLNTACASTFENILRNEIVPTLSSNHYHHAAIFNEKKKMRW